MKLCYHPCTTREINSLFPIEGFKNRKSRDAKRSEVVKRMNDKRWLHVLGTWRQERGRPLQVYCTRIERADRIEHEYGMTEVLFACQRLDALRGKDVDKELRPDAQCSSTEGLLLWEYHTGTMKRKDQLKRFQTYEDSATDGLILFVCKTPEKMIEAMEWASFMNKSIVFTTVEKVLSEPLGKGTWINAKGEPQTVGKVISRPL